jgi:hypothetical protein
MRKFVIRKLLHEFIKLTTLLKEFRWNERLNFWLLKKLFKHVNPLASFLYNEISLDIFKGLIIHIQMLQKIESYMSHKLVFLAKQSINPILEIIFFVIIEDLQVVEGISLHKFYLEQLEDHTLFLHVS